MRNYLLAALMAALLTGSVVANDAGESREIRELKSVLAKQVKNLGPEHADVVINQIRLARLYRKQGELPSAIQLMKRSLLSFERLLGKRHKFVAEIIDELAELYATQGHFSEAATLYIRVLAIREKSLGKDHPDVARNLHELGEVYFRQGLYVLSESAYKRSLAIREKVFGTDHPSVASTQSNLALLYKEQGFHDQALLLYEYSLAINEKVLGPNHPEVATVLNNLAALYLRRGIYDKAEALLKRSLAINEKVLGPNHPEVATVLNNLANMLVDQGGYAPAEPHFKRSLSIYEKSFGYDHPKVALSLNNRADLYLKQGNYAKAEPLFMRSLAIFEKVFGYDHPEVAVSLNNLAMLFSTQGNYAQSEVLYKRALAISEKAYGPIHWSVALCLQNLAAIYVETGRYTDAEQLLKRSLAISEEIYGPDHPSLAMTLNNLATLYTTQGNHALAEPLFERSLTVYVKAFGLNHPAVALNLRNLAELYGFTGSPILAEQLLKQSLAISEEIYGPDNPDVAMTLNYLAALYMNQNSVAKALEHSRAATRIFQRYHAVQPELLLGAPGKSKGKRGLRLHLDLLATDQDGALFSSRTTERFDLMQMIPDESTAQATVLSAARQSAPNAELATAVRSQQDAIQYHRYLNSMLIKALGEPPMNREARNEARLREKIHKLESEFASLGKKIANEFPGYAALIGGAPLPLAEAQALLRPDEALLAFVSNEKLMHVAILRPDSASLLDLPLANIEMVTLVRRIRDSLLAANPLTTAYDADAAHALHQQLFAPLLPHLDGVRDVLVVPEGALASLPFGVLLEKPTPDGRAPGLRDYRYLDWLASRFNFTTLPAVVSLKALRKFGKAPAAGQQPFFGIGDPLLDGPDDTNSTVRGTDRKSTSVTDLQNTGIEALRKLPSLPDTADELRAIAKSLGGASDAIHLRLDATETRLKQLPLEHYRVLGLATHGLLAGEIKGFSEPGLVLTPPAKVSTEDDGFLGASEVAELKLNADWVILSACNTAAADGTPGASSLSGLAKSFFYAGARTLLVSHWPVVSSATTRLITDTLDLQAGNRKLGKAGALRQAMLNMINDDENPEFAHPAFWAPFVVVGDGK